MNRFNVLNMYICFFCNFDNYLSLFRSLKFYSGFWIDFYFNHQLVINWLMVLVKLSLDFS